MTTKGNLLYERWQRIKFAADDLGEVIRDLDRLQVGDPDNSISPLKHELMATREKLIELSRRLYYGGSK